MTPEVCSLEPDISCRIVVPGPWWWEAQRAPLAVGLTPPAPPSLRSAANHRHSTARRPCRRPLRLLAGA